MPAIRVWVPGCSTGEEAYSIAILLTEWQEAMKQLYKVQVFATDIDSRAIVTARAGIYPASIAVRSISGTVAALFRGRTRRRSFIASTKTFAICWFSPNRI